MSTPTFDADAVLTGFSDCHRGIVCGLRAFDTLPELAAAATRSREVGASTLTLFDTVLAHHADEENELFPAVWHSATPGERDRVEGMIARLTAEHRSIEALWKTLKPEVKCAAAGNPAQLAPAAVSALVYAYNRHVVFEELEFLPLSARIFERNAGHRAALGLSLHLRHSPQPAGYI